MINQPQTRTQSHSLSPILLELLEKRGFKTDAAIRAFLHAGRPHLTDPFLMKGMRQAVDRIQRALAGGEKVLVHGDYDVDGVTGAAILAQTLKFLAASFETFLPDRSEDGYGVSGRAIRQAARRGVRLLITVDCGIADEASIMTARELGLDVIIVDHHRIPDKGLPPATVILNPLQPGCEYPFKELSAGGLAFKLSYALIGEAAYRWLDLTALSTVCDVAPLVEENRVLVREGLKVLSERKNHGLDALMTESKIKGRQINVGHIGFVLGPRINAAGRMSTPDIALRLLLTEHAREAASLASVLNEENKSRQREERQVLKEALLETEKTFHFNRDRVIVVARQGWHAGVIGIVAARLVERYRRPAVVIALDGEFGKGSARSIRGFHLFEALQHCSEILKEFGGHELAAGMTVSADRIDRLRREINAYAAAKTPEDVFARKFEYDLEIALHELKPAFIQEIKLLEPHGAGNPRPHFLTRGLRLKNRARQKYPDTYQLWLTDGLQTFEAEWRNRRGDNIHWMQEDGALDVIYSVKSSVWDGMEGVLLEIRDILPQGIL